VLCAILFIVSLGVAHQLPPIKAYYTPEQMAQYWEERKAGAQWGAALMMISLTFYLPYTASISAQMRRAPNLPYLATALQLAAGAAGIFTFITRAQTLALITFRLDRDPQSTQTLTDLYFFFLLMPWPTFLVQDWAWAYAILVDQRPRPVFPKFMAIFNIIIPCFFLPTLGMHADLSGADSYQGASYILVCRYPIRCTVSSRLCLFICFHQGRSAGASSTIECAPGLSDEYDKQKGWTEKWYGSRSQLCLMVDWCGIV
jgi:hypothetical protein